MSKLLKDTRLADNFGTWRTFVRTNDRVIWIFSKPAIVVREPSTIIIFLLLGQRVYVIKFAGMSHVINSSRVNNLEANERFI